MVARQQVAHSERQYVSENENAWASWTVGCIVEDENTAFNEGYIWMGKQVFGKHLIVNMKADDMSGSKPWYRLLTNDEVATLKPKGGWAADTAVMGWAHKAVLMDMGKKQNLDMYTKVLADWNALNALLNEYADEKGMCDEYESKLDDWNSSFTHMDLTGREKTYEIEVTITATYSRTIEVEATSKEAAVEQVENMDDDEVLGQLDMGDHNDLSWEVD